MTRLYGHSANQAGFDLLKRVQALRQELRARLTKPAIDDEPAWERYVTDLVRIRNMDHNELAAAIKHPELDLDHWQEIGHFYAPIASYDGKLLKYQGIMTKGNEDILREKHPEGLMLNTYRGDRIRADNFAEV